MPIIRYNVGAIKRPEADRDVVHSVPLRGYRDILGSDTPDDHEVFPVGSKTTYSLELDDDEAERFSMASNCRYLSEDQPAYPTVYGANIPRESTRDFCGYPGEHYRWHGRDVNIGICDTGTTSALRTFMNWTLVARGFFNGDPYPGEIFTEVSATSHGSWVSSCAIPFGGRIIDANIADNEGRSSTSAGCAAMVFCADNGAQLINYSFASLADQAWVDTIDYLVTKGVHLWASAGNDGLANYIRGPALYCTTYSNVHSVGSFNETTGLMSTTPPTNYSANLSGITSGVSIASRGPNAGAVTFSGTSAATPNALMMHARLMTGERFTIDQAGAALNGNGRQTGRPNSEQGGGAFDLTLALKSLGGLAPDYPTITGRNECPNPTCTTSAVGWSWSGSSSASGRVSGATVTDRPTGYNMTKSSSTADGYIMAPQSAVNSTIYNGKTWSFTYQIYTSQTCSSSTQIYSYDSSGFQIAMQESALVQRTAGSIFRSTFTVTLPAGTVRIRLMHRTVNQPINSNTQIFAVRYAAGNLPSLPYADGTTFAWDWEDGDPAGTASSGAQTFGTGLIVY